VQATQGLVAIIGGQTLAVQMDVQTTNADGSVAMATLTMAQPALAAGATEGGMLSVVPTASTAAAVDLSTLSGQYQLGVDLTMHNADGSTTQYNLDAVSLLQQALANGTATYVLRGAQVSEVQFTTPIAGSLFLTFDISLYANGSVAADVQFDNDLAMSPVGGTANYDVAIVQNGGTVLDQTGITQYQYTTWQEQVGTGTMPQAQVVLDMNALEKTGALPNYDPTAGISASDIANEGSQLGGPTYDILGSASVTQYMPTTGGRADIGPQPGWDAVWLMTQDPTAEQFALAQANASGSVPWHFIDSGTGTYISVIQYPDLWVDPRASTSEGYTPLTQPVPAASLTGWTADPAHQPDLSYAAYLLTGNQYYLSELNAQASWAEADDWTPYRQGGAGLVANGADQLRQQAWSLREVDEAAYANPDGSAMKAYFTQLSDNNWQWLVSQIPAWTQIEGQASGWMPALYGETNDEVMAPWQQDYFASTAVQAAEMGNQDAVTFLTWESNFLVGRFLNAENGFNPRDGVAYNLSVGDTSGAIYTTWAGIENASVAAGESNGTGWAQSQGDYGELALQSLAGIITVLQSPDAIEAYGYLINSGVPDLGADPQLDIVPRLSDGNLLTASNIILSDDTTATTISGSNNDQLIEAGTGDDTVIGGSGINILFAGSGNDVLIGGPTADYLYAGSGNDTLSAGAGTNYMMAGSGSDLFQLTPNDVAQDTIVAFKLGVDHLQLLGGAGTSAFDAQVLSGATSDGNGGSVLHLTAVHTVTLTGINPSELTTAIYA
jgi:Ca2+-binding RTX toxin-like protein